MIEITSGLPRKIDTAILQAALPGGVSVEWNQDGTPAAVRVYGDSITAKQVEDALKAHKVTETDIEKKVRLETEKKAALDELLAEVTDPAAGSLLQEILTRLGML